MRKTKIIKVTTEEEQIEDIICNKCESSLKDYCNMNYEGLVEYNLCGGYGSEIGDGLSITFSLCEKCLSELFKTFKIPPNKEDLNFP